MRKLLAYSALALAATGCSSDSSPDEEPPPMENPVESSTTTTIPSTTTTTTTLPPPPPTMTTTVPPTMTSTTHAHLPPTPEPTIVRTAGATPPASVEEPAGVWDRLAECESGGDWGIATGNGYSGGLQFSPQSWRSVGGAGSPHQASRSEQITRGKILQGQQGWGAWPSCSRQLGLR